MKCSYDAISSKLIFLMFEIAHGNIIKFVISGKTYKKACNCDHFSFCKHFQFHLYSWQHFLYSLFYIHGILDLQIGIFKATLFSFFLNLILGIHMNRKQLCLDARLRNILPLQ